MLIYRLVEALDKRRVNYAIAGGFAVALHGAVRGTVDIDLVLNFSKKNVLAAEATLKDLGLQSRLPIAANDVFNFREAYIKNKNLVAWNFYNPTNPVEVVDIVITHDLRKMKAQTVRAGGRTFRVVSIDDLIKMKKKSGRPQDLEDIKALRSLKK